MLRLFEVFALRFRGKIRSLNAIHSTSDFMREVLGSNLRYTVSAFLWFSSVPPKRLPGLYSEIGDVDFAPNPLKFTFHYYSRASDDANPYPALSLCRWITHNLSIHIGRDCVGKRRHKCEDMKTDLTKTGCEVRHWTGLAQDRALRFVKSWKFPDGWSDCSHCVRPA